MDTIKRDIIDALHVFKTIEEEMRTKRIEMENIQKIQKDLLELKNKNLELSTKKNLSKLKHTQKKAF